MSGNGQVKLTWNAAPGASNTMCCDPRMPGDPTSSCPAAQGVTGVEFLDAGLENGTPYHYEVKASIGSARAALPSRSRGPRNDRNGARRRRAQSLAVLADGSLWSWDTTIRDSWGRQATGSSATSSRPRASRRRDGSVGGISHSVALRSDGTAWAWVQRHGTAGGRIELRDSKVPVQVVGLTNAIALDVGGITASRCDRTVRCGSWGRNESEQLGSPGPNTSVRAPFRE